MGSVYPLKLIYRIVFLFLESWSTLMFWYLFSLTCAWYFFFKLDSAPYILLPLNEDNNYLAFDVIFGFVLGIKLILMHAKLMHQSFCSYYVLDREKNMNSIYSTLTNVLNQHKSDDRGFYDREVKEMDEPKAWRPLFVMNELNELSTTTVISVEVVLIWTSFLLVGENWKTAAHYDPIVLTPVERTLHSYAIMFFLFSVIILTIGMTIYIIRYSVSFLFSLPYMDFVDLCAVANVSLFIFDEKFHGYYIHGESPTKSSDVSLETLKKALDNEGDGNAASRGLVQKYPGLQTYEFYCPYSERKIFDDVFEENKASLKQKRGDEDAFKKKNQRADFIYKTKDLGMFEEDFRKIVTKRDELDYYLVSKIQNVRRNPNNFISDTTWAYNITTYPPHPIMELNDFTFVADRLKNFTKTFLLDLDFDMMWLMVCIYTALDALGLHVLHSTLIIYLYYIFLIKWVRQFLGERNISRTSGVDSRFLI